MMPHVQSRCTAVAVVALSLSMTPRPALGQETSMSSAGALKVELERLGTTARVLYVAAHPDDENTRLLTYLANQRHLDVAYLSMTRGGGGQNLIGPEQAEMLAAIRTQELLAARRTDGARQFFTRARDFGYSKTPKEAIAKWGRDEVLSDVVWVIRRFRPDVVVTRFTEDGSSHGHHTASAQLARAAFEAAADPKRFPEQLRLGVTPWAPHRLALNVPLWRDSDADVSGYLAVDVGGYDARLGASYGEIAAWSRTNHKSQGFGSSGRRGPIQEYFDTLEGPPAKADLLEGVTAGWDRFEGGERVQAGLKAATASFSVEAPERMVPGLLTAREALVALADRRPVPRVLERINDVDQLIAKAMGLYAEVQAERPEVSPGDDLKVELELVLRRPVPLELSGIAWPNGPNRAPDAEERGEAVAVHRPVEVEHTLEIPRDQPLSVPHWLREPLSANTYPVPEPARVADPEDPPPLQVALHFSLHGRSWSQLVPVTHGWTDRVHGARRRPVIVVPPMTVTPASSVTLMPGGATREVTVVARAGRDDVSGEVKLALPRTWKVEPNAEDVALENAGDVKTITFTVTPPSASSGSVVAVPTSVVDGRKDQLRFDVIDYPHLPVTAILRPAQVRLVPVEFDPPKDRVGYVPGPGDTVAEDLRAAGMSVETIDAAALRAGTFDDYQAILMGVRAYNTREEELRAAHPALMRWVQDGGTLVVQYNTNNRWRTLTAPVGPYPFEIGQPRVTDETAVMTVLEPQDPIFNTPHEITAKDFEGWVQERGLYFAKSWDDRYTPLIETRDPDEEPTRGSLLVARHGKGTFVYTGLSFFRQLPAGVPGAYRLLANILAGQESK